MEQETARRNIHDKFVIYATVDGAIAITSEISVTILDSLKDVDMTASDISKKLDIVLSTVNNHINALLDFGLIAPVDPEIKDQRKRFYHRTCMRYVDNITDISNRSKYRDKAHLTLNKIVSDPKESMLYSYALGYNFGLSIGINYEHLMRYKGRKVFEAFEPVIDPSLKIEEFIDVIRDKLLRIDTFYEIEIQSYNPLTMIVKYVRPFPEYPNELVRYSVEEFLLLTLKSYFNKPVSLGSNKLLANNDKESIQELSFFI